MKKKPRSTYKRILRFGKRGPSAKSYYICAFLILVISIFLLIMNEIFICILFFISSILSTLNGYFYRYRRNHFYGYFNKTIAVLFFIFVIYLFSKSEIDLSGIFLNLEKNRVK